MQDVKFQSFILSSQHMQCVKVLQAYLCCFSLQQGVSGSSANTIVVAQSSLQHGVINNAKRKWQIIDTNG
jgi:hypothetical protein